MRQYGVAHIAHHPPCFTCPITPINGAAQESNLPSLGLPDLTGFEDRLGHRARAAPGAA
jgi:hypothetical protein